MERYINPRKIDFKTHAIPSADGEIYLAYSDVRKVIAQTPSEDVVPKSEYDKLDFMLTGVMYFVDKWLEGKELEQDEVNRAITMREKTLRLIENTKTEVAREIFAEIKKCMAHDYISSIGVYNGALAVRIALLKKKYAEGNNG